MLISRRALALVRIAPGAVALAMILGLAAAASSAAQWTSAAIAMWRVMTSSDANAAVLALVAASIARALFLWGREIACVRVADRVKAHARGRLLDVLAERGPGELLTRPTAGVHQTITEGVDDLDAYVGFYLPQVVACTLAPLVLVGVLTWLLPAAGLATGLGVVAVLGSRQLWQRVLGERARVHWEAYARFAARIHDTLSGMSTLRTLGASRRHGDTLAEDSAALYRSTMASLRVGMATYLITGLFMGIGTAVATALGALALADGSITVLAALLILVLAADAFRPVQDLQAYWHEGFGGLAALRRIDDLASPGVLTAGPGRSRVGVDAPALLTASAPGRPGHPPIPAPAEVVFDQVTFTYPGSSTPAVRDVSFTIPAGATLAVVGPSGSGKSTLVALLTRLFDPQEGRILIGGVDLATLPVDVARSLPAVVSQDTYLFHGTIADNLRLGAPAADDDQLRRAAVAAGIHEAISSWPQGYQTPVGERGARLSGGERQRLAIARALLKDAPVLILDEATASVDGHTEALLQRSLTHLAQHRSTLVVAHRYSSLACADQILVLSGGVVTEIGAAAELTQRGGAWTTLLDAQLAMSGASRG